MKFQLNVMIKDFDVMKKVYTAQKMDALDKMFKDFKELDSTVKKLDAKIENCALKEELDKLSIKMDDYTTLHQFGTLKNDMKNKVGQEDFRQVVIDCADLQKQIKKYTLLEQTSS